MEAPTTTKMNWLETVRQTPTWKFVSYLVITYLLIIFVFASVYYIFVPLTEPANHCDCNVAVQTNNNRKPTEVKTAREPFVIALYFSAITASTVGYGDYSPKNTFGKVIVMIQIMISTALFAIFVSIAFMKMMYPRNAIILSQKIIYNPETGKLCFRIINVNRAKLINPEIRIVMAEHTETNGVSSHVVLAKIDALPPIGNHDFSISFQDQTGRLAEQLRLARAHDTTVQEDDDKSGLSIKVSVSGSYGFSSYTHYHKYKEANVADGGLAQFEIINYPKEFHAQKRIYSVIPDFWHKFHNVIFS